jgi:hypothetical protein
MYALWATAIVFNALFDDDDDKLRKDVRLRPHLTFGSTPDGTEILHFPRVGNINDILEWIDLDELRDSAVAAWDGRKPWHGAVWDVVRGGPMEKLFLSVGHHIKYFVEASTNQTYYPNIDRPRSIESWPEKIAQDFGFGDLYRTAFEQPRRSLTLGERAADVVLYRSDPGESAYYDTLEAKRSWLRKEGIPDSNFTGQKPTTVALRNMKKALRYKDQAAFNKYLTQYIELGGTESGLDSSIKAIDPMAGLNKQQKLDFIESLTAEDKRRLYQAIEYYNETFSGDTAKTFFSEFQPDSPN